MSIVANLVVRISAATTDFEKDLKGIEGQFKRVGGQLQSAGSKMTAGLTVPLVAFSGLAVKAAIDFESSFAGIKKTVNITGKTANAEFAAMAQGMRDMAKEMPVGVNELNKIGEAAGQLGISKNDILDFTKTMAMLGATTNLTSDQAATGIAQIQNVFGASGQNTQNFASALVALGNAGASTESQILDLAQRLAGAGTQAHMSQAEVLGMASAIANVGIEAEKGGTAMSITMSKMGVAVDMGGAKLAKFAEIASLAGKGVTSGAQFKDLFKNDSAEAITRFVEGLKKAGDSGKNVTSILGSLGLKGSNVRDVLLLLAGSGDNLRNSLNLSKQAWQDNTALTAEYQKRAETTASQLQVLWNKINDVAITLGTAMLPTLKVVVAAMDPLIGFVANLANGFAMLPVPVQAIAIALVALAAAAGPVVYIAGTLISSWGSVLSVIKLIPGGTTLAGAAFALLTNPITIAIGLLATLAIGFAKVTGAAETMWNAWQKGGWAAVKGELGRNVNDDRMSIWTEGRLDKPKQAGDVGDRLSKQADLGITTMLREARDTQQAAATTNTAADEMSKAALRAAKAHADAIKALAGGLSGATAVKELTDLVAAWKSLSPELQKSDPVIKHVLDKFMQLGPELTNVPPALRPIVAELNKMALAAGKFNEKIEDGINNIDDISKAVNFSGSTAFNAPDMWGSFADVLKLETPGKDNAKNFNEIINALPDVGKPELSDYINPQLVKIAKETVDSIDNSFKYFAGSLSAGMAGVLGGMLNILKKGVEKGGFLTKLFGGKAGKAIGTGLDIGMAAFGGGFGFGEQFGKGKGALAGAGSGALSGALVAGPFGAVIGGIAGLIGGLFGGKKKHKEELAKMGEAKQQLLDQFGSMEKLQQAAQLAGVSVDLLFSTDKAKVFQSEMTKVTEAIKVMQERIATTVSDIDKVMAKGGLIGKDLWQNILKDANADEIKAKLEEVFSASVSRAAEGFNKIGQNFLSLVTGFKTGSEDEKLLNETIDKALKSGKPGQFSSDFLFPLKDSIAQIGVLADAAFAGLLADGMSVAEAINQIAPGLQRVQEILAATGQTASGPLAQILNYQSIVQANQGLFELVSGVTDMLTGLGNAGLLTQERFSALGSVISTSFANLTAQGVAGATAIELLQPGLQRLWEAQQLFGLHTDAATQSLLNQAVQQGVVGENMKDVNGQILDVLKAIATALGAEIPGALQTMAGAAGAAVDAISPKFQALKDQATGVFSGIPHSIDIDMRLHGSLPPGDLAAALGTGSHSPTSTDWLTHMASGGIVSRPTLSLIGEDGPEAVVPLDDYNGAGGTINITVNGTADAAFAKTLARAINRGGDVRTAWEVALR